MFTHKNGEKMRPINLRPVQILAIGFAAVILIGALILMLPVSSSKGEVTPFLDCLFTSTSAVCVTGLVVVDTGTHWSVFGQIIVMLLIQVGGVGFMTFATLIAIVLGKRISLKERLVMQEAYNSFGLQGIVKLALYVMAITFSIEGIGAILLSTQFIQDYGWVKGIYFGIFHAVTAFCNAGFDLIGNFRSITPYVDNATITLTIGALIALGGLGFAVIAEVINYRKTKRLSLHSKVAITTTIIFIVTGFILFFIFEYNNPGTMKNLSLKGKILASLFASITPRTAGYNSISTTDMTMAGKFLTIILMFLGAAPGSTGGGIKVTTTALIVMTVVAVVRGREDTEIFGKRIPKDLVYKSIAIVTISMSLVIFVTMILVLTHNGDFMAMLYEATSAFGTVGLTMGFTSKLNVIGKIVILLTMYAGRVGPLTLALAFTHKQLSAKNSIRFPEDKILVG